MSYSFLRESKLYIVYGGTKYRIYTSSAISLNQTFAEDSYSVKTLHDQSKMFEGSIINKANPASFSFDVPLTIEKDESVIIDLLSDLTAGQLTSFDIYIVTTNSTFKLENAVITNSSMDFIPDNPFIIRLEGEGTKLTRVGDESQTIPGDGVTGSDYTTDPPEVLFPELRNRTRTPLIVYPVISADSLDMTHIISVNLRISNEINWTNYSTLQDSLLITNNDTDTIMFPSKYTVERRTASGEIRQYQVDNNVSQFDNFSTNTDLTIKAIKVGNAPSATPFFQIRLNPISYTARVDVAPVFTQSYDFKSLDNTALDSRITQYENNYS